MTEFLLVDPTRGQSNEHPALLVDETWIQRHREQA